MHPVQHLRTRRVLDAWVDGELDETAAGQAEQHVRRCARCHAAVEAVRLIKQSLRHHSERQSGPLAAIRLRRFAENLLI